MNYLDNNFAYVVEWEDMNGKSHQDEIVRIGFYDSGGSRSWVHDWNNINDGLKHFLTPLPKHNTTIFKLTEHSLACLRSEYIVIPVGKLIEYAEKITKVKPKYIKS